MQNLEITERSEIVDDGDRKRIAEGGRSAAAFMRRVAVGKKVDGKRYKFDGEFIKAIHKRVAAGMDWGGRLREENVGIDEFDAVSWHEVPTRYYLFSRWLEHQMQKVSSSPDDIIQGLETASAAHYGLTQPELHPFAIGNGRTARALTNAILMSCTDELRFYNLAIPPVPILRSYDAELDRKYIKALRTVRESGELNPLMTFIAKRWSENLADFLNGLTADYDNPKNNSDKLMIDTLGKRKEKLDNFIGSGAESQNGTGGNSKSSYIKYPVPAYFDQIWLKD